MTTASTAGALQIVPGRECGSCSLCCKVYNIVEIDKAAGKWCGQCKPGRGCKIHDNLPTECAQFNCLWRTDAAMPAQWKPDQAKMVTSIHPITRNIQIQVDPGLPSQLLERRPDVAAAERRVASANANIGVARAAYFPVFTLSGAAGVESTAAGTWFTAPSRFWSLGPQALLTLFDAGRHAAESQRAHAAYDEQVADYRDTVLRAYQEVEDNLAALRELQQEQLSQAAAVQATQGALDQALLRYRGGIVSYLEVVATENAALTAHLSAVDIEVRRASALVLLVRALGGDWHPA